MDLEAQWVEGVHYTAKGRVKYPRSTIEKPRTLKFKKKMKKDINQGRKLYWKPAVDQVKWSTTSMWWGVHWNENREWPKHKTHIYDANSLNFKLNAKEWHKSRTKFVPWHRPTLTIGRRRMRAAIREGWWWWLTGMRVYNRRYMRPKEDNQI